MALVHILLGFMAAISIAAAVVLFIDYVLYGWDWVEVTVGLMTCILSVFVAVFVTWANFLI